MYTLHRRHVAVCAIAPFLIACKGDSKPAVTGTRDASDIDPHFTMGSGTKSTLLGRATFTDPDDQNFKVKRISGDWHVEVKSKPAFDLAVQNIVFAPGGQSGWHTHPGPVFIQVVRGTMTFYKSDDPTCAAIVRTAGQGYLDVGDHPHIARNEAADSAQNIVTYFAPPGAQLRIDEPNPGNCSF